MRACVYVVCVCRVCCDFRLIRVLFVVRACCLCLFVCVSCLVCCLCVVCVACCVVCLFGVVLCDLFVFVCLLVCFPLRWRVSVLLCVLFFVV